MPYTIRCRFYEVCENTGQGNYKDVGVWICAQCKHQAADALANKTTYGGKSIQCPDCYHIYSSWRKMCQHYITHCKNGSKIKCPICKMEFFNSRRGFELFFRHIKRTRFRPHESGFEILDALDGLGKKVDD